MRILSIISGIRAEDGGPVRFALDLNEALVDAGCDATLSTIGTSVDLDDSNGSGPVVMHRPSRPKTVYASRQLKLFLRRQTREFDLIHVNGLYRAQCRYVRTATNLHQVPYLCMPHGGLDRYQAQRNRGRKAAFNMIEGRRFLAHSAGVIFTDSAERAASQTQAPFGVPQYVLPIGVTKFPSKPVRELELEISRRRRGETFLYLGRLAKKKQPDVMLKAWAKANRGEDDMLFVVGPDDYFSKDQLARLSDALGVTDSVRFFGAVSRGQASWLYERAGVFILPSQNENFGMTISEAMLAGCAIATTDVSAASAAVVGANAGWISKGASQQAIDRLLNTAVESRSNVPLYGANAKSYASSRMTWTSVVSKYIAVYQEITDRYRFTRSDL